MRKILFRAKRLDNGEWVEGYVMIHDHDKATIFRQHQGDGSLEGFEVNPETVCQSTGLTDKNGNKIWETDVCQYIESDEYENEKFVVKYGRHAEMHGINLGFYTEWLNGWYRSDICFWTENRDIEVIGNIFDNPELVEGGAE